MYIVNFSIDAEEDIQKATKWYHMQVIGLEFRFYNDLNNTIKKLQKNPLQNIFYRYSKSVRRVNLTTFPYKILYNVNGSSIFIIAILHHKRSLKYIKRRIK